MMTSLYVLLVLAFTFGFSVHKRGLSKQKELKFAQDTIQIRAFIDEYQNYPSTTTTIGMIWSSGYELEMYQNLLNKEYKELISWFLPK